MRLACPGNATIASVVFASYGTPNGSCADPGALAVDPACNAPSSAAVARAACVGRAECILFANDTTFGGVDPCHGVRKRLVVAANCAGACAPRFVLNVTVPVGSAAAVTLPIPEAAEARSVLVTEAGAAIFREGSFVPHSAEGVTGAEAVDGGVAVATGGGRYAFTLHLCVGQSAASAKSR